MERELTVNIDDSCSLLTSYQTINVPFAIFGGFLVEGDDFVQCRIEEVEDREIDTV